MTGPRRLLRHNREEILDREGQSPRGRQILEDLDRFNRIAGWYPRHVRAVWHHWEALGRPRPFRVLDIGTGQGGLLEAIADQARRVGLPVTLMGVDRSEGYTSQARARLGTRATVMEADATALPFESGSFDLATCTLMLHHLPPEVRVGMVAEVKRVARSFYLFDVEFTLTGMLGWPGLCLGLGLGLDTLHDGVVSVMRGHTIPEIEALVAGLPVRVARIFPTTLATLPLLGTGAAPERSAGEAPFLQKSARLPPDHG